MRNPELTGITALSEEEMEATAGGDGPPGWWWLLTYLASEGNDFVQGVKDGFNAN